MKPSESPRTHIETLATHKRKMQDALDSEIEANPSESQEIWTKELPLGAEVQNYIVRKVLGSGGFGVTYLAYDQLLDRHVVLKENFPDSYAFREPSTGRVLPRSQSDTEHYNWALRNFIGEARTIASLDHPGIVRILSIFECNDTAYFAMDYIHGLSLEYLGDQMQASQKHYSEPELLGLLIRLLDTLIYVHEQNICHRDIKPANILISKAGTPILIDFGAARETSSSHTTKVLASHGYSAPEQALNLKQSGGWSDVYSLAASFFFLLMGRAPERSEARIMMDTEIKLSKQANLLALYSAPFLASIDKALEPRIDYRYKTAEQWLNALPAIEDLDIKSISLTDTDLLAAGRDVSDKFATHSRFRKTSAHTSYYPHKQKLKLILISLAGALLLCLGTIIFLLFNQNITTPQEEANSLPKVDLNRVPISRFAYHNEIPTKIETTKGFLVQLNNPYLIGYNAFVTLPEEINLSSIVLQKGDENEKAAAPEKSPELFLELYDSTWTLIARSQNAIAVDQLFRDSLFMYSFPLAPTLSTKKTYHAYFVDRDGTPKETSITLLADNNKNKEGTAKARYYGDVQQPESSLLASPLAKEIQLIFKSFNSSNMIDLKAIPLEPNSLPILQELARRSSAWADYTLYLAHNNGVGVPKDLQQAYIHLYTAAWKGCIIAQRELASIHSSSRNIFLGSQIDFPDVKQDENTTYRFFRFASNQGDPVSNLLLGFHYSQGWGVPKSKDLAEKYFSYAAKSKEFNTSLVRPKAKIFGYWTPHYMPSQKKVNIKTTLKGLDLSTFKGIRLVSINNNFICSFSNFRLLLKDKVIGSNVEPVYLQGENLAQAIQLPVPAEYSEEDPKDFSIEFEGKASGEAYGVIEIL